MDDRRTMSLALVQGERRQVLLEAGSTVLVVAGRLALQQPMAWLAEQAVRRECRLEAEQAWVADEAGWVDLTALATVRVVIMPPDTVSLWRQVGRCLEALVGALPSGKLRPERVVGAGALGGEVGEQCGGGRTQQGPAARA